MKKNVKKLLLLMAVVITAVVCFTFSASALDTTGKIGDNVTYSYNNQTKQLVISGSGKMWDYYNYDSPFCKSDIKEVVIENGVTSISYSAFYECTGLTSITIPDSVTTIGDYAFYYCSSLTSITIPDSVTTIGNSAFRDCESLTSVTIGDSVTTIGNSAFRYCTKLTSIIIPDSVTSIGWYAFYDCTSLASITLPFIGGSLTKNCFLGYIFGAQDGYETYNDNYVPLSLKEVILSDKCTSIPSEAFYGCARLTSITIPDSVTTIGSYAFSYCSSLTSITIPDSVTLIGDWAFFYCTDLTSITIPDGVTSIGAAAFYGCSSLKMLVIPASVTFIGEEVVLEGVIVSYQGSEDDWSKLSHAMFYGKLHFNGCMGDYVLSSIKASTCTAEGEKIYDCSCGQSYFETIDALGHKYSSSYTVDKKATCTKAGSKSQHCTRNGCTAKKNVKSISALGHSYGAYKTTKKATLSANGTKTKTCSRCSGKATATIYYPKTIKLSATSYIYNGKAKKPTVTVKDSKGNTLKNGTDYKVTYSANTAIGTAKATVSFMGNYSGSKALTFKIILGATDKISATQGTNYVKLSWNKVAGAKGYKIYAYDSKGELQLTKSTTKTSITVDDLSKGTKYKFTVKAYAVVSKKTVWSEKTKSLTTATKPGQPTLKATAGKGKVSLSWTKQNGSSGYVVYMATSKKSDYKKIGTLEGVANLKMTKSKLTKGKKYYFKVRAYKTVGSTKIYGAWSSVKSVKVK